MYFTRNLKSIISVLLIGICTIGLGWGKKKTSSKIYDVTISDIKSVDDVKDLLKDKKLDEVNARLCGIKIVSIEELTNPYDDTKGKFAIVCAPENPNQTVNIEVTKFLFDNPLFEKNFSSEKLYDVSFVCAVEKPVSKAKANFSKAMKVVTFGVKDAKDVVEYQILTAKEITTVIDKTTESPDIDDVEEVSTVITEPSENSTAVQNEEENINSDPANIEYKDISAKLFCKSAKSNPDKLFSEAKGYKVSDVFIVNASDYDEKQHKMVIKDVNNKEYIWIFSTDYVNTISRTDPTWLERISSTQNNENYNGHYIFYLYGKKENDQLKICLYKIDGIASKSEIPTMKVQERFETQKKNNESQEVLASENEKDEEENSNQEYPELSIKKYNAFKDKYFNKKFCIKKIYILDMREGIITCAEKEYNQYGSTYKNHSFFKYDDSVAEELYDFMERESQINIYCIGPSNKYDYPVIQKSETSTILIRHEDGGWSVKYR